MFAGDLQQHCIGIIFIPYAVGSLVSHGLQGLGWCIRPEVLHE